MKLVIVVLLFGLVYTVEVNAQTSQFESDELLNSQKLFFEKKSKNNLLIQQIDDAGNALLASEHDIDFSNKVFISQTGIGHNTTVSQKGNNNEANLWSIGEIVKVAVKQEGDGNQINSYIENAMNVFRSASLLQEGNFNKIELSLIGDGFTDHSLEQSVSISQYGNQHEVKALMEPFSTPLEINQTPGTNGEGMKIDVSTSAFSFPMK